MSEIKRIAEAVRDAINGTVIMRVDEGANPAMMDLQAAEELHGC